MIDAQAREDLGALRDRLRPFVARRVRPSDVDDVLQDVLLRMHRGVGQVHDDERFGAWVYRVARTTVIDHLRARARVPVPTEAANDEVPEDRDEPGDELATLIAAQLGAFVARLPSPYREAITMTELEGLTQDEAARRAGVSLSGMKSRVQRGREKLRAMLHACCAIELDARGGVVSCAPRSSTAGCACDRGEQT